MTTTVATYDYEASRSRPKWPIHPVVFAGGTASAGIRGEVYDFQSPSMRPQNPPQALIYCRRYRQEQEYTAEVLIACLLLDPWKQPETEVEEVAGVYAPPQKRQILFFKKVNLRLADLPQRSPYISPSMLASDDNEGSD